MSDQCTATSSRSGQRCKRAPIDGGTVCATHGGRAPQVRAAAERRLLAQAVEADAKAILAQEGLGPIEDPLQALAELASQARALMLAAGARVNALSSVRYESVTGTEQLRSEMAILERAMDRTGRFLEVLQRLDYEGQRVRLAEDQGALVWDAVQRILDALGLTKEQRDLVPDVVQREFLAITGGVA